MQKLIIADLRKARGETQEQVAGALGVSRPALANWERSDRIPTVLHLLQLAAYYGVPVEELFDCAKDTA